MLGNIRRSALSRDPEFQEGRIAFANGVARDENPYAVSGQAAANWDAGWEAAEKERREYLSSLKTPPGIEAATQVTAAPRDPLLGDSEAHPLWHIVLFIGLVVIFFPWSLLLLLFLYGWDGTVQVFRGLVIGTVGLAVFLLWLAIWLAIVLLIVIGVIALIVSA